MLRKLYLLVFAFTAFYSSTGQTSASYLDYILNYGELAMKEQIRTGFPAAVTMAQGLLESAAGRGSLCLRSNNHFGIKCKTNWQGMTATHDDDEKGECFRAYASVEASYRDHSDYVKSRSWYAPLFQLPPTAYEQWAKGLHKAGYATNPQYASLLIKIIETYHLNRLSHWAELPENYPINWADSLQIIYRQENPSYTPSVPVSATAWVSELFQPNSTLTATEASISESADSLFKLNGLQAIYCGTSTNLLTLCKKLGLSYTALLLYNDLVLPPKEPGILYLEPKNTNGTVPQVTCVGKESLWSISQQFGIRLVNLQSWNSFSKHEIIPAGTVIKLKQ